MWPISTVHLTLFRRPNRLDPLHDPSSNCFPYAKPMMPFLLWTVGGQTPRLAGKDLCSFCPQVGLFEFGAYELPLQNSPMNGTYAERKAAAARYEADNPDWSGYDTEEAYLSDDSQPAHISYECFCAHMEGIGKAKPRGPPNVPGRHAEKNKRHRENRKLRRKRNELALYPK